MPGMRVIQFGFSDKGAHMHLPHRYEPAPWPTPVPTTTTPRSAGGSRPAKPCAALPSRPTSGLSRRRTHASPVWPLIRATAASVAQLAIVPAQDLFELGSEARMNTPSVPAGQLELARARRRLDAGVGRTAGRYRRM